MNTRIILFICTLFPITILSQAQYEIHFGPAISNVKRFINGEQVVFRFKENAPFWNFGFQIGCNRIIDMNPRIQFSVGTRLELRGDLDGEFEVLPDYGDLNEIRFLYFLAPVNIMYKIFPNRKIYIQAGISPDYLLDMNAPNPNLVYFPGISFFDRFGLTGQLGYKIYLGKKWGVEVVYSQSLTSITSQEIQGPTKEIRVKTGYKHQAFEFSAYYKL